jgi:hypothetical protein
MSEGGKYAPVPGTIPGTVLNLGGYELTLAPLNLAQVEALQDNVANLGKGETLREAIAEAIPLIHASLLRNYPAITTAEVRELIDIGNFRQALEAVISISGYSRAPAGEPKPASP